MPKGFAGLSEASVGAFCVSDDMMVRGDLVCDERTKGKFPRSVANIMKFSAGQFLGGELICAAQQKAVSLA